MWKRIQFGRPNKSLAITIFFVTFKKCILTDSPADGDAEFLQSEGYLRSPTDEENFTPLEDTTMSSHTICSPQPD